MPSARKCRSRFSEEHQAVDCSDCEDVQATRRHGWVLTYCRNPKTGSITGSAIENKSISALENSGPSEEALNPNHGRERRTESKSPS